MNNTCDPALLQSSLALFCGVQAHDVMAIKCRGTDTIINFVAETYLDLLPLLISPDGRPVLQRVREGPRVSTGRRKINVLLQRKAAHNAVDHDKSGWVPG